MCTFIDALFPYHIERKCVHCLLLKSIMSSKENSEESPLLGQKPLVVVKTESGSCSGGPCGLLQRIRHSRNTAIAIMFLAFLMDLMLLTVIEPVLPDILKTIQIQSQDPMASGNYSNSSDVIVSSVSVGILNGAKPFTQVLLNPIIGVLVDKVGHTVPMLVGFIVAFLSTLGFAYLNQFETLLVARCVQGLGSSLMTIAGLAMLSSMFVEEKERGKAMGIAFSGLAFGLIIGFPFGSIFYQFFGREVPFLIMAGIILLGIVLRFCLMPIRVKSTKIRNDSEDQCSGLTACLDPYILLAAGVYFWLCYGVGSILGVGPLYLLEELGAEQWMLGILYLAGGISQTIFQYSVAAYGYKVNWWPFSMMGLIIVAIGAATYTLPQTFWLTLLPQCFYSGGIGFVMGSIPPMLGKLADIRMSSQYGAVYAMSDTGTNLGYFMGSTLTGIMVNELHSFTLTYSITAIVIFCYAFLCIFLRNVPIKTPNIDEAIKQALLAQSWKKRRHSLPAIYN